MSRRSQYLALAVVLAAAVPLAGCRGTRELRRSHGGSKPFFGTILGQRVGHEMNEGRRVWWMDYLRMLPSVAMPFKVIDGCFALFGYTNLERARWSGLEPPTADMDYMLLLKEAHKLGVITDAEYERQLRWVGTRAFPNMAVMAFVREEMPSALPDGEYTKLLQQIRYETDAHVYFRNRGLLQEAKKRGAITEQQFRFDKRREFWEGCGEQRQLPCL